MSYLSAKTSPALKNERTLCHLNTGSRSSAQTLMLFACVSNCSVIAFACGYQYEHLAMEPGLSARSYDFLLDLR
jgi:hypothetical protein